MAGAVAGGGLVKGGKAAAAVDSTSRTHLEMEQ